MLQHPSPVRIRIRSASGELYAMGPGKAELLTAILEAGSIAAAGRKLGMSYQKTRQLVDEMNQCFPSPVVTAAKGGLRGGGAQVTTLGQEALTRFRRIQAKAFKAISSVRDKAGGALGMGVLQP